MTTPAQPDTLEPVIDVQTIPPHERHPLILQTARALEPGSGFLLVNDHDPRPLYHQIQALFGNTVTWSYLERGPDRWWVRIAKPETNAASTVRVRIAREGAVSLADPDEALGGAADGALVCAITDCPPGTTTAEVLNLMHGVIPPAGQQSLAFERLVARRSGSCCGGMCG
ncbi:DUF2249 domain-containing protein [Azospirillum doebereinerae]|uniref:DUF2249 domain-containing protein n=1 Tax=Azospirillum doebereinerae TaxID=92933 RepID=UPI001EE605C8|nr:DUF2249 domain-containing protein [Azospirillum doebereinerae]MCG5241857.1 DUF2249 domain-containing protein [Azospirillum doebereinerae]